MRTNSRRRLCPVVPLAAVLLLWSAAAAAEVAAPDPPLRYELHFDRPNSHLLDITIHAGGLPGPAVKFAMPAWAPGAYEITDYAKMVQEFSAAAPDGRALPWRKTDKQTWRIELGRARAVTLRYKLYGNTLRNNWVQYNDKHAFIAGPAAWMYLVGGQQRPVQLTVDIPAGWKVATGLRRTGPNTFSADDYDWLADSPLEISDYAVETFTYAGSNYHVVVHDINGPRDFSKVAGDTQKIVEAIVPWFAGVVPGGRAAPFEEYWFLFHIWPHTGGGLEHLNSTQINFATAWEEDGSSGRYGSDYNLKLYVIAHEFYHAWNVKRLRPRPLGPFDYSREVHTPSLWISEGITSYYGQLALVRAGLIKPEDYLKSISELITEFEKSPGRSQRSIEETSWDTWFEPRPPGDTNLPNTNHSYYDSGQIVGHLLDFAIRHHTGNRKSLDDWMRLLYSRHALPRPGFTPDGAVRAASEVAGTDLSDFFRRHISGKEPLPYETYFGYAGITVERTTQSDKAWLGVSLSSTPDGKGQITNVLPGGPALEAGLDRDDILAECNDRAVSYQELVKILDSRKPGDTIKLKVRRVGGNRVLNVKLGADRGVTFTLKPMASPGELQKQVYESWLGIR